MRLLPRRLHITFESLPIRRSRSFAVILLVTLASAASGQAPAAPLASVHGEVRDAIRHTLLAGATVQLALPDGRAIGTQTDSLGRFHFDSLAPGHYLAGFFHTALEDLGVEPPVFAVDLAAGDQVLDLSTPAPERVLSAICAPGTLGDSTGLVVGRVVDADSDRPLAGATVRVQWIEVVVDERGLQRERHGGSATTNAEGLYAVCGIPIEGMLTLFATSDGASSGAIDVEAPTERVLRQRVGIARSNTTVMLTDSGAVNAAAGADGERVTGFARGRARLRGLVVDAGTREPLGGAAVTVRGSGISATTNPQGEYALAGLPAGTQMLEVRAIGYSPRSFPVLLRNDEDARTDFQMDARVPMLETVRVFGKAPDVSAFAERKRRGMGRFMTQDEVQRIGAFDLTSIFRRFPGIRVLISPTGHVLRYRGDMTVDGRAGCVPTIFLNGLRLLPDEDIDYLVDPRSITGIEVYPPHFAPMQYMSDCASVVIWSGMVPR